MSDLFSEVQIIMFDQLALMNKICYYLGNNTTKKFLNYLVAKIKNYGS